jgi:hypothetical protein
VIANVEIFAKIVEMKFVNYERAVTPDMFIAPTAAGQNPLNASCGRRPSKKTGVRPGKAETVAYRDPGN